MKILIIGLSLSCYNWWSIKDIKFYEIWITNSSKVTIMRFINNKKDITNSKHCQGTMNKIENDKQWTKKRREKKGKLNPFSLRTF